jgi:broad specificity phosphatase PhoE
LIQLYLVRHGESEGNAERIHQDARVGLSARGMDEARLLAQFFTDRRVDAIVSSSLERALQTATIIGETLGIPVSPSALFVEIKRPTEIEGRFMDDPEVVAIKNRILDNWHDPQWRHSDEETFFELRARAIAALDFLAETRAERLLVVMHGQFMRLLVCVMALGPTLQPDVFKQLQTFLSMSNCAVTQCEYQRGQWQLITWNDRAHLRSGMPAT